MLTLSPERAAMGVVLAMAGVTIGRQRDFRDIPGHVTGLTIEIAVRPGQRISRLRVVIEAPPRPTIRVVAKPAIRREAALVVLVLVTLLADGRCIFI